MSDQIILALIAAIPSTIAAVSSLKNGREQKRVRSELLELKAKVRKKKALVNDGNTASNPEWYNPPVF